MAIEAVKIPSNIQVEEQIVGPLSLRQIIIILLTGGLSYAIWTGLKASIPNMNIVFQIACWVPMMIGVAFSFVQVNGVSLLTLMLLQIEGLEKPAVRTFGPRTGISINIKTQAAPAVDLSLKKAVQSESDLAMLSSVLDKGLNKEDEETNENANTTPMQAKPLDIAIELEDTFMQDQDDDPEDFTPMRDIYPTAS